MSQWLVLFIVIGIVCVVLFLCWCLLWGILAIELSLRMGVSKVWWHLKDLQEDK